MLLLLTRLAAEGASSLDDLTDVSYTSGSLEPTALDQIVFSSGDVPGTDTWKVYANSTYGATLGAYNNSSFYGSYIFAHPTKESSLGRIPILSISLAMRFLLPIPLNFASTVVTLPLRRLLVTILA